MWLPLSKPGGSFVATRNAFNDMQNQRAQRKYNEVKADWANTTIPAAAYSQMAYANAVAPQFMAKLLQDPKFLGNLSKEEAQNIKNMVLQGATKPPGFNSLNQPTQHTGTGQPSTNNISGGVWNALKGLLGINSNQPAQNPMQQQNMPQPMPQQGGNAFQQTTQPSTPMGQTAPQSTAPAANETEADIFNKYIATPEGQAEIDKANRGEPSRLDIGAEALAHELANEAKGISNNAKPLMGENPPNADANDYLKNGARAKGILKQGEKSGEYRATALNEAGKVGTALSNSGAAQNEVIKIIKNPIWQHARDTFPGFQKQQLSVLKVTGNPELRKLIGEYTAAGQSMVASQVAGMGSKHLVREYDLAEKQKINDSDTIESSEGKLTNAKNLHDIAEQKNHIIKDLLKRGVDEADAVEIANKKVDISAIRRATDKLLERRISVTNNKTGVTKMMTVKEAQKEGVPNV